MVDLRIKNRHCLRPSKVATVSYIYSSLGNILWDFGLKQEVTNMPLVRIGGYTPGYDSF